MQPVEMADDGVIRFKANKIIRWLYNLPKDRPIPDLNEISIIAQTSGWEDDMVQFWQLLGYSVSGYGDLSFVPPEIIERADAEAETIMRK